MSQFVTLSSIENRPRELRELPFYNELPQANISLDVSGSTGEFLSLDVLSLDGVQPIERRHMVASGGIVHTNPSSAAIAIYRNERVQFQLVHVVVNCYAFAESDGGLVGRPYNISLQPAGKRGRVETVGVNWVERIDLERLNEAQMIYRGFNPFRGAYGFAVIGDQIDTTGIESDMLGFVHGRYALALDFRHEEVLSPDITGLRNNRPAFRDYQKFRNKRFFKPFTEIKPRRIWGCDSPIELFLLQSMNSLGLQPEVQTIICSDGLTVPHVYTLWENHKSRRKINFITEADFYFSEHRLAVFCDSVAHHSTSDEAAKDARIDRELREIGIRSLRINGRDIVNAPLKCASQVLAHIESGV